MKTILNYTGQRVGVTNSFGTPSELLPIHGKAYLEIKDHRYWGQDTSTILQRIKGLPAPDRSFEKLYIVTKEVAEWLGNTRKDLLVAQNPIPYEGAMFYNFN